jgi:hypothetical protein
MYTEVQMPWQAEVRTTPINKHFAQGVLMGNGADTAWLY